MFLKKISADSLRKCVNLNLLSKVIIKYLGKSENSIWIKKNYSWWLPSEHSSPDIFQNKEAERVVKAGSKVAM